MTSTSSVLPAILDSSLHAVDKCIHDDNLEYRVDAQLYMEMSAIIGETLYQKVDREVNMHFRSRVNTLLS